MSHKLAAILLSLSVATSLLNARVSHAAHSQAAKPAPADRSSVLPAERKLAPEIVAQHQKFQHLLSADVKRGVDRMVPAFQEQVLHAKPGTNLRDLAFAQVRREFPRASAQQIAALSFELIAQSLGASNDSASDISNEQQLELQLSMQEKAQMEDILSNLLKTFQDTSDSVIQNIK